MKKFLSLILMVILLISILPVAFASDDIKVTLNGKDIEFDQPPVIVDGRTLVPIRAVCEALGAVVDWNEDNKMVVITCLDDIINNKNRDVTFFDQFVSWGENVDVKVESAKGQLNESIPTNPYTNNAWAGICVKLAARFIM